MSYIPAPVQAVIDLFQGPLAEVRFADVDVSALASLARAAESAAAELAEQEARLGELRQMLADRQEALLLLAQRGLAYARVYAEQDEALTEQLSRINLPKATKPRKASSKPTVPEPTMAEVSSTPGSDAPVAPSAEGPSLTTSLLDESAADEPARDDNADDNASAEPALAAKAPSRGKRRSGSTRDDAQSRPG